MSEKKPVSSKDFYDIISSKYEAVHKERSSYNLAIDNYLSSHRNQEHVVKILDLGSGSGERITKIFSKKSRIFAVDESPNMCFLLRQNSRIEAVIESDINSLEPNSFESDFDLVTMLWNVPGHIRDLNSLFQFCYKVLKPGGRLIFDVNNPLNFTSYGISSGVRNFFYFYIYPRNQRRVFEITLVGLKTKVAYSPVSHYKKSLEVLGFDKIQVKYFDYDTGKRVGRFEGQILIDAIKV